MSDMQNYKLTDSLSTSSKEDFMGAAEVFEQMLEIFKTGNMQVMLDLIDEDAVMEFPFAPSNRPSKIQGKNNIIKYNQAILDNVSFTGLKDVEIHRTLDPDCVIVEMTGYGSVITTGDAFERRYIDVCRTENGRIKLIRDYWNPEASINSKITN